MHIPTRPPLKSLELLAKMVAFCTGLHRVLTDSAHSAIKRNLFEAWQTRQCSTSHVQVSNATGEQNILGPEACSDLIFLRTSEQQKTSNSFQQGTI